MCMPKVWNPGQGLWDPLKFLYKPQTSWDMKLVPGPAEPLRIFELKRWQTWKYTLERRIGRGVALAVRQRGL